MFPDQFNTLKATDVADENEYSNPLYSNPSVNPHLENNNYQDINNFPYESWSKTIDYRPKGNTNEANCKQFLFIK